jgi:HEAT repeat protein
VPNRSEIEQVNDFLQRWNVIPASKRARIGAEVPVAAMMRAALSHPDPWARRSCLSFLDHYANDESAAVFAAALADPVATVRKHALHGLACERCRVTELPVPQVVPELVRVLAHDASPDVRQGAVPILFGLQARDPRARPALARAAAAADPDPLVRTAARAALDGRGFDAARSRKAMRRRARRASPPE